MVKPKMKGRTMPAAETAMAALPCRMTVERSTSRPTTKSRSVAEMVMKPSSATFSRPSKGKIASKRLILSRPCETRKAEMTPKMVGPRMMPARISPSTEGWRNWRARSPRMRARPKRMAMPSKSAVMSAAVREDAPS